MHNYAHCLLSMCINRIFIDRWVFAGALFLTINRLMHYYASVAPCAAKYTVVCLCVCVSACVEYYSC